MESDQSIHVRDGFPDDVRASVAAMYWAAFRGKLEKVLTPEDTALALLRQVIDPHHAISAISANGRLLGVAGFKTSQGAFVEPKLKLLARMYGVVGASWRGVLLALYASRARPGILSMDGIFVDEPARGRGVGSRLLKAVKARAHRDGCDKVSLAVIDTNSRARALYERMGFAPTGTVRTGPLRHVFGFRKATYMVADAET